MLVSGLQLKIGCIACFYNTHHNIILALQDSVSKLSTSQSVGNSVRVSFRVRVLYKTYARVDIMSISFQNKKYDLNVVISVGYRNNDISLHLCSAVHLLMSIVNRSTKYLYGMSLSYHTPLHTTSCQCLSTMLMHINIMHLT